jgi:hypothetical protein
MRAAIAVLGLLTVVRAMAQGPPGFERFQFPEAPVWPMTMVSGVGAAWIASAPPECCGPTLYSFGADGSFASFPGLGYVEEGEITVGRDHAVWSLENGLSRLDLTTHVVTTFAHEGYQIDVAPDGNLWIPSRERTSIQIVSPSGQMVSTIATSTPVYGAEFGADGAYWYLSASTGDGPPQSELIRVAPSGESTRRFPLTADTYGGLIAAGDGFWASGVSGRSPSKPRAAFIRSTGEMEAIYDIPVDPIVYYVPTADRNGDLWFTWKFRLLRLRRDGVLTEYTIPQLPHRPGCNTANFRPLRFVDDGRLVMVESYDSPHLISTCDSEGIAFVTRVDVMAIAPASVTPLPNLLPAATDVPSLSAWHLASLALLLGLAALMRMLQ